LRCRHRQSHALLRESLGFVKSKTASPADISLFGVGRVVLALWGRAVQIEDGNASGLWTGHGGIVVAQNVASEREVDAVLARAEESCARTQADGQDLSGAAKTDISRISTAITGDRLQSALGCRVKLPD
jgi:hypothetical protein